MTNPGTLNSIPFGYVIHPGVARTLDSLGVVLRDLGDLEGAKKCHERALKIFQDKLGEDHPHTMRAQNNLAALERKMSEG